MLLRNLKKKFDKIHAKDTDYDYVMDVICENNRLNIVNLCSICVAIFSTLVVLGIFNIGTEAKDIPVFLCALLYSIGVLFLVKRRKKQSYAAIMLAT